MMAATEFYIYGRRPIMEALRNPDSIEKIYVRYGSRGKEIQKIRILARKRGIPCVLMSRQKFTLLERQLSHDSTTLQTQGVIALRRPAMQLYTTGKLLDRAYEQTATPLLIALDRISDPHNLGAILRTCEAAGVNGIIIPQHHSVPLTPTVWKASAGAIEHLPIARVASLSQALIDCKHAGLTIIATLDNAEHIYTDTDLTEPIVLLFGSEHQGIHPSLLEHCDQTITIPMAGTISSLNVSVACGIILFEAIRQRRATRQ